MSKPAARAAPLANASVAVQYQKFLAAHGFPEVAARVEQYMRRSAVGTVAELPGPVGERYRKNNIAVASPPILLDLAPGAEVTPFFVTAGVSGLLGFCMLVAAGAVAMRQRRLAQT